MLSFLQTKTRGGLSKYYKLWFNGSAPLFYFAPLENECIKLNANPGESTQIDLAGEFNEKYTATLGYGWTIVVGFNIEEIPEDAEYISIFSHSSNDC